MGRVISVLRKPGRNASVYEAAAFGGGGARPFVVCTANIDGVLEGAVLDGELGDEAGGVGGGGDAGGVVVVCGLRGGGALVGEGEAGFAAFRSIDEAAVWVSLDAEGEDKVADGDAVGAVLGDGLLEVLGVDDFHRFECPNAGDFFVDALLPSVFAEEVVAGLGVAGARGEAWSWA